MRIFTVVYQVEDEEAWGKTNPLNYEHDGAKAVGCSVGDLMAYSEALERQVDPDVVQALQEGHVLPR